MNKYTKYCKRTLSPCWHVALRHVSNLNDIIGFTFAGILALIFLIPEKFPDTDDRQLFTVFLFLVVLMCITGGFALRYFFRSCLYLNKDFISDFETRNGLVIRSDMQKTDGRIDNIIVRARFDWPYRDVRRLGGVHTQRTIDQLLQEYPGIAYIDAPYTGHPSQYFLDRCNRFMLRTSYIDLYWLAQLKDIAGATVRLHFDQGHFVVKALSPNVELQQSAQQIIKEKITIEGTLLEVLVGPSWLRVRVIGGTWLGSMFSKRIAEGIAFAEGLVAQLGQRYAPLDPDHWTLSDTLEVVSVHGRN